jgi:hypothetical protein
MKIDLNMTGVGEPTEKMWRLLWDMENVLGIQYKGSEEFKYVSKWISLHMDEYMKALDTYDDDWGYEYYDQHY